MRQHISRVVILIALLTALSGCAGGTSATSTAITPTPPAGAPTARSSVRAPLPSAAAAIGTAAPFLAPGQYRYKESAARTGDVATLGALLLLFGLVVIAAGLVADLTGAWADPRQRRREGAP